jgi:hypothetical protein
LDTSFFARQTQTLYSSLNGSSRAEEGEEGLVAEREAEGEGGEAKEGAEGAEAVVADESVLVSRR